MTKTFVLCAVVLVACTHATPPARPPCPAAETAPVIPPEDAALRRWKAIAATPEKLPPAGTPAAALVPELLDYLGSPDPVRRDAIAFEVLTQWLRGAVLSDADARALAQRLLANLADATSNVFRRSFSALVLGEIVRRDTRQPYLSDDERHAILGAARDYAARETDLRGHTGTTGWAHAAAHTADLLARLAQLPAFDDADRAVILDAVASFVVRRHGTILASGEDGRLAVSVIVAVKAGVSADAIAGWLARLREPLAEKPHPDGAFDAALFAAQRNARNLLFTLFVQLSMTPALAPGEQRLLDGIRALLAE